MTRNQSHYIRKLSFIPVILLLSCLLASASGYRINWTPSLPQGIWKVTPLRKPVQRGQIVSICPVDTSVFQMAHSRQYLSWGPCPGGYISLLKPVCAVAGDQVVISRQGIAVNGIVLPNSTAATRDSAGRPLNPLQPGTYKVKPGTIWLVSNYPKSFDSRYFGPLPSANILGTARPVWVMFRD